MKKSSIFVTWSFLSFHKWESAPNEVIFLRDLHRHKFKCKAKVQVKHSDREIEFFIFQKMILDIDIIEIIKANEYKMSCEQIAEVYIDKILNLYPCRSIKVEVSEDGENGSIVEVES